MKTQLIFCILLVVMNVTSSIAQEPCVTNAWNEYNSGNYTEAIVLSEQCIDDFGRQALKIQYKLDSLKIVPETGAVNDVQKNRIFQNGLLNDISQACYIKGRSAEKLYKQDINENVAYKRMAIGAYEMACDYSKGRCWDPKGWFWSPCEASSERLPIE